MSPCLLSCLPACQWFHMFLPMLSLNTWHTIVTLSHLSILWHVLMTPFVTFGWIFPSGFRFKIQLLEMLTQERNSYFFQLILYLKCTAIPLSLDRSGVLSCFLPTYYGEQHHLPFSIWSGLAWAALLCVCGLIKPLQAIRLCSSLLPAPATWPDSTHITVWKGATYYCIYGFTSFTFEAVCTLALMWSCRPTQVNICTMTVVDELLCTTI